MIIRSTATGKTVVRFESMERVPDEGFVTYVDGKAPRGTKKLSSGTVTLGGIRISATEISVEKAFVIVWGFETMTAREERNLEQAVLVGGASTHQDLVDLFEFSQYHYLGYKDPKTGKWMSYTQAEKLFGEEPWASM